MAAPTGSLGARVEAYVGVVADQDKLTFWLTDGVRHISVLIPKEELSKYAAQVPMDASGGTAASVYRFVSATRNARGARVVPHELYEQFTDSSSLHYVTELDPVAYFRNEIIYGFPTTGTWLMFAIPFSTVTYATLSIANFPKEYEHLVVLYATVQAAVGKVTDAVGDLPDIDAVVGTPDFTWTDIDLEAATVLYDEFDELRIYLEVDEDIELAMAKLKEIDVRLDIIKMNTNGAFGANVQEWGAKLQMYTAEAQSVLSRVKAAEVVHQAMTANYSTALQAAFGGKK